MSRILHIALLVAAATFAVSPVHAESPVKVYVLVGQSNMQGKGAIEGEGTNTLQHLVRNDPGKEYQFLVKDDGAWVEREDVWIYLDQEPIKSIYGGLKPGYGSSGGQVGPELGFGHMIGDAAEGQVLLTSRPAGEARVWGIIFCRPVLANIPSPSCPVTTGSITMRS